MTTPEPAPQHSEAHKQGQSLEAAAKQDLELGSTINKHSGTKQSRIDKDISTIQDTKMPSYSISLGMKEINDMSSSKNPQINTIHTDTTHHSDLTKDQRLQEEERILLAKIHLMTGDTSNAFCPRTMKRLVPAPGDIDCDVTEPKTKPGTPTTDHSQHSIIPCFDALREISLTEAEESLGDDDV